jgi:hypothetical protein
MGIHDIVANRRYQNLDTLESNEWGPTSFESSLVVKCHELRRKPIGEFSIEDLRLMIGQNIGPMFLVPIALEKLNTDPLCEGDLYEGDLLCSLLRLPNDFWNVNSNLRKELEDIILKLEEPPDLVKEALRIYRMSWI